jgi:divalent metal cation (Fe/Co/Zn/Cd) transporter
LAVNHAAGIMIEEGAATAAPHLLMERPMSVPGEELGRLLRRGFWLEGTSMAWTMLVAAVAMTAGAVASSIALIGVGLESLIELVAAAIVVWQLAGVGGEDRETRAMRLIGATFLASAAYLLVESIRELAAGTHSAHSGPGLAVAVAALLVMPVLALGKRSTGRALGSRTLITDAAETALAGLAAGVALLGQGLDTWLGWWWAVPAAGIFIAVLAATEGIASWRHRH